MDDLISRQDAIDATWFEPSYTDPLNVLTEVRDRLKALPSAQPDVPDTNVGDTISRQAAIDALMAWEEGSFWDEECLKHRGEPYWVAPSDVIEQLPSAQPTIEAEPIRRGRWEVVDYEEPRRYGCSACKRLVWHTENYCPNCGARMEDEE